VVQDTLLKRCPDADQQPYQNTALSGATLPSDLAGYVFTLGKAKSFDGVIDGKNNLEKMRRGACAGAVVRLAAAQAALPNQPAPQAWTWEQVKDRLELNNPTLLAGKLNISEMQADEITAICGRILI